MDLKLPPLGEGVDSGAVVSLLVKEGEELVKGQSIIEIETGKAVAPVPSAASGKITKILISVGDKISVGQTILSIAETAGSKAAPAAAPARPAPSRAPAPQAEPALDYSEPVLEEAAEETPPGALPPPAAPAVRRVARELGINLLKIRGSERGGRIVMNDLRAYIARLERLAAPKPAPHPGAPAPKPVERIDFAKWGPVSCKPMTQLRKIIAQRMLENWNGVPHVTQFDEADITLITDLRKKYAPAYDQQGAKLTLTSFALRVIADTLKKHPIFNSSIDEATEEVVTKNYIHIGLAVDTDQGLIVPVIRDVDKKDLLTLSKDVSDLAAKTRDRKISLEQLTGGTFTISNQGGIGGGHFTPIINKPEVAILGLGRGAFKAVVRDGKVEPRLMLPLALSYDHRLIDGGSAARFMLDLVQGFEKYAEESVKLA